MRPMGRIGRMVVAATAFVAMTGCQAVIKTEHGHAAICLLTNSSRVEVGADGKLVVREANVSNPVGTGLAGLAPLVMPVPAPVP